MLGNDKSFNDRLCWALMLPLAWLARYAVDVVFLAVALVLEGDDPASVESLVLPMKAFTAGYVAVLTGAKVAPDRKAWAALGLAVLYVAYAGLSDELRAHRGLGRFWVGAYLLMAAAGSAAAVWKARRLKPEDEAPGTAPAPGTAKAFVMAAAVGMALAAPAVSRAQSVSTRAAGNLVFEDVPEAPPALAERMLQYQNTRSASVADWAEGGLLLLTRFGETSQVHRVAKAGGARTQLTFFKEPVGSARTRPSAPGRGLELAFLMDAGGTENYQAYLYRRSDGKSTMLTDGKSRNESLVWSRSGRRLAFLSTARNGRDFDLHAVEPGEGPPRLLIELEGQWELHDWSPDDSKLLVSKYISINESYPYVADIEKRTLTPLFPDRVPGAAGPKVAYGSLRWSPGGKGVYFTSDEAGEFTALGHLDLGSRRVAWLSRDIPWNVETVEVSPDGRRIAFAANQEGFSALYLMAHGGKPVRVSDLPLGVLYGMTFDPEGRRLGFTLNSARSPGDAYVLDWSTRRVERWTESETGGLPPGTFVEPELARYPTFDSVDGRPRTIPAFYYKPRKPGPHPFVLLIHGGPEAQARPYFNPMVQYWVNELGVAVLEPNVRGSDGYGKSYLLLDNGMRREDSVKDIGALLDWASRRPELDASRAAVYGGSYGGYMVLASLARFPDRLKCGVDVVGISNFVTFLENTKEYRRDLRRPEYGDERDPKMREFLVSISPTTLAPSIRSPLFVIQGANDPRVPASEAEGIVAAVRNAGRPVWYLLAKDEGHGFSKKTNRDAAGQAAALFWERHLLP